MNFKFGTDPELFLQHRETGKFISACGILPGTKESPFPVNKGAVQVDGVAFEFNTMPALTVEEFLDNITSVTQVMQNLVKKVAPDLRLVVTPTALFDKDYFSALPEDAKKLGCEPDYNAYTGEQNQKPETDEPFRTGAGHLHVGWTSFEDPFNVNHFRDCRDVAMQLDAALYVPSLLWDNDDKRRELYGSMGAFRPKSYGVEYRPLSNSWVADPDLQEWIFNTSLHAMNLLDDDVNLQDDKTVTEYVDAVLSGGKITRAEAISYAKDLSRSWEFPRLPAEFMSM